MSGSGLMEKVILVGIFSGVVLGDLFAAAAVALIFGFVSASHQYNAARKSDLITFDVIDFGVAMLSSFCVGMVGFFGSDTLLGFVGIPTGQVALVIVAILAVAGYRGLDAVVDILLDKIRGKDKTDVIINNNQRVERPNRQQRPSENNPPDDDFWDDTEQ